MAQSNKGGTANGQLWGVVFFNAGKLEAKLMKHKVATSLKRE